MPIAVNKVKLQTDQIHNTNPTAGEIYQQIHKYIEIAHKNLEQAKQRQTHYANQKRTEVDFDIGQMVYLSTANFNKHQS